MTGSKRDRENHCIQLVKVLYSKLLTNNKQLPAGRSGQDSNSNLRGGRRESGHCATVDLQIKVNNVCLFIEKILSSIFCQIEFLIIFICLCIYLFGVLRRFQHCTGHITTGSWKGRGNQYIQFVRVLYCKLPTNGKQLPLNYIKCNQKN